MNALAWNNKAEPWEVKYYYACQVDEEYQDKYEKLFPIAFPIVAPQDLFYHLTKIYIHRIRVRMFMSDMDNNSILINDRHSNGRFNLDMSPFEVQEGYIGACPDDKIKLRWHPFHDSSLIRKDLEDKEFSLPILCSLKNSCKGRVIRPQEIVRIDYSNKKNGAIIWQHPDYEEVDEELFCPDSVTIGTE
jgi:hypothetical protein